MWQADDIDGITMLFNADGLEAGTIVDVRIDDVVEDVNFAATMLRVTSAGERPAARRRSLPVAGARSTGSFGR